MPKIMLAKLRKFVKLLVHYAPLVLEHCVVTDHVMASATMARRAAIDRDLGRWEAVSQRVLIA
jgi:hypothetical protein